MLTHHNNFNSNEDIIEEFNLNHGDLDGKTILLADYTYEDYSGDALVIYEEGGKLYEVNGGHCSCYGLEGQWSPEETTWEALKLRDLSGSVQERLTELCTQH